MTQITRWIAAARPQTLPAAVVPVAVGTACAAAIDRIAWGPALAVLGAAIAIQIGTNFANDVFDAERGADGPDRIGPVRAVSAGLISAAAMKRAMIGAFSIATAFGLYIAGIAGWPIVAIGIASIAAGLAYTGGPYPLGYHGLGDVFVFAFFGLVAVCGTTYVQVGWVPPLAMWSAIPVGAISTAILVVNNLRDRPTDARVGKRTLAVRLGRTGALTEYAALLTLAYAVPIGLSFANIWRLLPLATLPFAVTTFRRFVQATTGVEFNACLIATARLLIAFGLLLAAGLAAR